MRFYLFDRVTHFEPGISATGIKNVSSQEEFFLDHYDRAPLMPSPLIVESIAQLGGWTITVSSQYKYLAVMVMVKDLEVSGDARPGDQVVLNVQIENMNEFGAKINGEAVVNGTPILKTAITYGLYEIPPEDKESAMERYNKYSSGKL